jgi:hypothetical protein
MAISDVGVLYLNSPPRARNHFFARVRSYLGAARRSRVLPPR